MDYAYEHGEGPKLGHYTPLADFGLDVLYNVASGTPFTPTNVYDEVNQNNLASQPEGSLNSRQAPGTQEFDLKMTKTFPLAGLNLGAYVWVLNAFNTNNAIAVYSGTGSAYTTGYFNTPEGQAVASSLESEGIDPQQTYRLALQNQSLFSIPRTVRFGLRMGF